MSTVTKPNSRGPRVPLINQVAEPESPTAPAGTPSLDAAVLRVQAKAGKLVRNATGQIQLRTYTYVTLDAITDMVLPLLVEEELLWKTFPTALDGEPALRYRMTHVPSGEYDEDTMLLLCDRTSQGQGSGETYARRYSVVAYLNLTVDPDDDGAGANAPAHTARIQPEASAQPRASSAKGSETPCTANQRKMLRAKAGAAKLTTVQFANVLKAAKGEPPSQSTDEEAAGRFVDFQLHHLPKRLVDDVIAGIDNAGSRS